MTRRDEPIKPMKLGNMRQNGVRVLAPRRYAAETD
jgi:hypothetical protein